MTLAAQSLTARRAFPLRCLWVALDRRGYLVDAWFRGENKPFAAWRAEARRRGLSIECAAFYRGRRRCRPVS